ncbi:putative cobalt-precorrin-6B C(15)-methyltransferase (decarboxylating) [Metallosphaera sp. J1]|nr:putative cobalt-precorrin-6B C(15)-methyltransferase (decarboxylating) [Metallosphaera javensis (ex Hofmann et al. 2022)]
MFPLTDDSFFESQIPGPTKEEIRAISISKMRIFPGCKVLEIGTGTGAVSVDLDRLGCYVISLDLNEYISRSPGRKLSMNVDFIQAESPLFSAREVFDSVFIGGTQNVGGSIELARALLRKGGRVVINAFTLESLGEISRALEASFQEYDVIQVSVSKAERLGKYRAFIARNPVYIFYASKG